MNKKITIIDYGVGNILSIKNAINFLGEEVKYSNDYKTLKDSTHIILPGVGAFPSAMERLKKLKLIEIIQEVASKNIYILGICLGMQVLFEKSSELKETMGLNLIKGEVINLKNFTKTNVKLPHIGWNKIIDENDIQNPILKSINKDDFFYFVHNYAGNNIKNIDNISYTNYGNIKFPSMVQKNNIFGCQFHPEKSGKPGLSLIKNFIELKC